MLDRGENPGGQMTPPSPYYATRLGAAYLGDSLEIMRSLESGSINLAMTSPPFALTFQKEYGNKSQADYVAWFVQYAREVLRLLADDGSFVLDIGGAWNKGTPTRSLYHYKLIIALCEDVGFHLAQDCFWFRPASLPVPAEWVTVRRIRIKDSVNYLFWLSKTAWPKASNRNVLTPYSGDMARLIKRGYKAKSRPSGHQITHKFQKDNGGAIPPNLLQLGNNDANGSYMAACARAGVKPHPARFPEGLPEYFVKLCTDDNDTVLDPFAGSNVTGFVAERLGRRWAAIELDRGYLEASRFRFESASPEHCTGQLSLFGDRDAEGTRVGS